MSAATFRRIGVVALAVFAAVTLIGAFAPFHPIMPSVRLDASWQYAINEAVARHLTFGRDIIFTYGPYASVSTQSYDPATDHLMLSGGLFLGVCYTLLLLYLAKHAKRYLAPAFLLYVAAFVYERDALLFSYPLILMACSIRFLDKATRTEPKNSRLLECLFAALVTSPLGLLPLIKGTYLILSAITVVCIFSSMVYRRRIDLAFILLVCPVIAVMAFWKTSGQTISTLPGFFMAILPIISGYTEAMASGLGDNIEILAYLVAAVAIVLSIARTRAMSAPARVLLGVYMFAFFFLVFKSSFVRHDSHAAIAGASLVMAAAVTGMLFYDANLIVALCLSVATWLFIDEMHTVTSADVILDRLRSVYIESWTCLPLGSLRGDLLNVEFNRSLLTRMALR